MTKRICKHSDIFVCVDCGYCAANGPPDEPAEGWTEAHETGMQLLADHDLQIVNGDSDKDYEFSARPCDLCRSYLAGTRMHCVLLESVDIGDIARVEFDDMLQAYKVCALWSSTDDDGEPLDKNYFPDDIADETAAQMSDDLAHFLNAIREWFSILNYANAAKEGLIDACAQFGHDFWLTRNGHGAGFWDRGLGELGDKLTAAAEAEGTADLYVGEDNRIHQY